MGQVTISGRVYDIYGTQSAAKDYFVGDPAGDPFTDATSDAQKRALVGATRWIDREDWAGVRVVPGQALDFEFRTGLIDCEGIAVLPTVLAPGVEEACYELALSLISNSAAAEAATSAKNTKKVQGGTASVEFFRPGDATGASGTKFPTKAQKLLRCYFGGPNSLGGAGVEQFGDGSCTEFDSESGLSRGYA